MSRKITQEQFLLKAKQKHGDIYNYDKVVYSGSFSKITISCKLHGDWQTTPAVHLRGSICPKCSNETRVKNGKDVIKSFNKKHNNLYDYSISKFKDKKDEIEIICELHGVFKKKVYSHLRGSGCDKCRIQKIKNNLTKTTDYFIEKAKVVHGDKYNYEFVKYTGGVNKVFVECKTHGKFKIFPYNHLKGAGCNKCFKNNLFESFISKSKMIHGDKYDYSMVVYVNLDTNVDIICSEHGVFSQLPRNHVIGFGCRKCGYSKVSNLRKKEPTGWSYSSWDFAAKRSKWFDSFKLYVIECYNEHERFYKIGKTFLRLNQRFDSYSLPYKYNKIAIINGDAKYISHLEDNLKNINKSNRYTPKIPFKGMFECFSEVNIPTYSALFD